MDKLGKYAFIAGAVLAIVAGLLNFTAGWVFWVLALLGLVVGFLNVTGEETHGFLLAAIALLLSATSLRTLPELGERITPALENLSVFISPAALIVALKALFETAKD